MSDHAQTEGRSDGADSQGLDEQMGFEEAHTELEEIVRTLELWERGEKLYAMCTARLDAAHGRVEELTRELEAQAGDADGSVAEPEPDATGDELVP